MIELSSKARPTKEEREPLFKLDGKQYTIPTTFRVSDTLTYVRIARTEGYDAAVDWALCRALGEAEYTRLTQVAALTDEQFNEIASTVLAKIVGRAATPKSDSE